MTPPLDRLVSALSDRYRIERELGHGGMATVYLAQDLKHDRKVALKVLRPELAAVLGAERFVQEIKTTAALQHPHILPLFDSGTADGFLFYVMPFIDGETLRAKLDRETQLGIDEAVRITADVADALQYAHEHGVIHRDVKPENILLANGRPMVADFGIALAVSAAAGGRMTETGLSLGTPHYMSPEQATAAKEITARSDVYSLASVCYEMLAGEPPHTGASAQAIIMKIVAEDVAPVTRIRKSVPANVAAALGQALEKLPADRFPSAKAFAEALTSPAFRGTRQGVGGRASGADSRGDWRRAAAVPAMGLVGVLLAALAWSLTRPAPPAPVGRFQIEWPGFGAGTGVTVAISRDGTRLATLRSADGRTSLHLRRRDQLTDVELPGTEGAGNPAFSPDGNRIAFMQLGTIRVADLSGGPPTFVTDSLVGGPGLAWGFDGYIYYDGRGIRGLMRIREKGGIPEEVSTLDSTTKELQHVWPDPLPDGHGVIMVVNRGGPGRGAAENDGIAVLDLKTGRHRELFAGVYARYAPSGHLLYVTRGGTLMAVPFDPGRLEVTGSAVALAEGLSIRAGMGAVDLAISNEGTLWYATGGGVEGTELAWATRDGTISPFGHQVAAPEVRDFAISPDGKRLAFAAFGTDGGGYVGVMDIASGRQDRLTFDQSYEQVAWAPNGKSLVVMSTTGGLFTVGADGSPGPVRIPGITAYAFEPRWTADGSRIVFAVRSGGRGLNDIWTIRPGLDTVASPLVATEMSERTPSASPDGRWLLYRQDRGTSATAATFVRPLVNPMASLRQVSEVGGQPRWSPDGREIYYEGRGRVLRYGEIAAVPVLPGPGFAVGPERVLFRAEGLTKFDVAPDGRFILLRTRGASEPRQLVMVENFFTELKAKVPR